MGAADLGDIYRRWPEQMSYFSEQFTKWHADGAETAAQVRDRVLAAVESIAAENEGKTVAVFSHGYAIRLLLATLQGYTLETAGQTPMETTRRYPCWSGRPGRPGWCSGMTTATCGPLASWRGEGPQAGQCPGTGPVVPGAAPAGAGGVFGAERV